jgi:acyl-coenzyme A synthetase/AMP-(fatty) acid ligase
MQLRNLYDKVRDGSKLTNEEVLKGAEFYEDLAERLAQAGPAFVITANEAGRVGRTLRMYATARGLYSKPVTT